MHLYPNDEPWIINQVCGAAAAIQGIAGHVMCGLSGDHDLHAHIAGGWIYRWQILPTGELARLDDGTLATWRQPA